MCSGIPDRMGREDRPQDIDFLYHLLSIFRIGQMQIAVLY